MRLGKLEVNLEELQRFIVKAKKKGYAGSGEKIRLADGSKIFIFQEGNLHYADNYSGSEQAPGFELVRWQNEKGPWIWLMSYSGGMNPRFFGDEDLSKETFEFLKKALSQVSIKNPFRGPPNYEIGDFSYAMNFVGDFKRFSGKEQILDKRLKTEVFSQNFNGGLAIPK
ncbi:hypothetical protein HY449_04385 [Candidatus Pacearchaeota archaeon]|nr:hypothetical protein [Candidatus Pacearchaeota archaeon]